MPDFNLYRNPNLNNALDGRYPAGNAPADPTRPLTTTGTGLGAGPNVELFDSLRTSQAQHSASKLLQ